jgi:hypothetical protein
MPAPRHSGYATGDWRRAMTRLEHRYRRQLRLLPPCSGAQWEQDMVATFLASVDDEVACDDAGNLVAETAGRTNAQVLTTPPS